MTRRVDGTSAAGDGKFLITPSLAGFFFVFFSRLEISDARGSSKSVTESRSQLTSLLGGGEVTHAAAGSWRGAGVKTIFIKQ